MNSQCISFFGVWRQPCIPLQRTYFYGSCSHTSPPVSHYHGFLYTQYSFPGIYEAGNRCFSESSKANSSTFIPGKPLSFNISWTSGVRNPRSSAMIGSFFFFQTLFSTGQTDPVPVPFPKCPNSAVGSP